MDLVLGAGLTGLTLAKTADLVIGFPPHTAQSNHLGAYTLDRGIHVLNTKTEATDLVEYEKTERNAKIITENGFVDYPYQSSHTDSEVRSGILNYEDFLVNSFGKRDFDDFHRPYNEKFWGVDLTQMSATWTKKPHFPKGKGANAVFYYPKKGGIGAIYKALEKKVKEKIVYGRIKFIDAQEKRVYYDGQWIKYDRLHNTLPLNRLAVSLPIDGVQEKLHNTAMYVYSFAIFEHQLSPAYRNVHWVYFASPDTPYIRISFPTNWNKNLAPKGMTIVQCESPYLIESAPERFLYRYEIIQGEAVLLLTDRVMPAYCVPLLDTETNVKLIHDLLETYDIYNYGRYGRWTNMWMHECLGEKIS